MEKYQVNVSTSIDNTTKQNEFIDALEDADERMQRVFREMAKEECEAYIAEHY